MTLPKGFVPPNKKTDEKAKQLADEKAKQLADEKAKQLADEKAKQLADEKAKQLADEKAKQLADEKAKQLADEKAKQLADEKAKQLADEKAKQNTYSLMTTRVLDDFSRSQNSVDYALLWDEMKKAYMQTIKESTVSYFRLLDFWLRDFKK